MTYRAQAELLRAVGIYNMWGITAAGHPMLAYRPAESRACQCAGWMLTIKGKSFEDAPWYNHGSKSFSDFGKDRHEWKADAMTWIAEHFPNLEMVKSPFDPRGAYVPKCDLDAALTAAGEAPGGEETE